MEMSSINPLQTLLVPSKNVRVRGSDPIGGSMNYLQILLANSRYCGTNLPDQRSSMRQTVFKY